MLGLKNKKKQEKRPKWIVYNYGDEVFEFAECSGCGYEVEKYMGLPPNDSRERPARFSLANRAQGRGATANNVLAARKDGRLRGRVLMWEALVL